MSLTSPIDKVVQTGIIGTGQYATAIVTQAESIHNLNVSVLADRNIAAAQRAYHLAGIDEQQITVACNRTDALTGIELGKKVILEDAALMMNDLPIDVLVEGTGDPSAGASHAVSAIKNGIHVVMVTKETDICVGTVLRQMARQADLVYSAADGDQPSHLISLVEWCQEIGLEVLCGGKFGEKRVIIDISDSEIRFGCGDTRSLTAEDINLFTPISSMDQMDLINIIEKRKTWLGNTIDIRTDDLTEQGIVANATGLTVERDRFHHPVTWPTEIPIVLAPQAYGGILEGRGIIEQTTYLRANNDTSLGGGVYVTVHAKNKYSREIISGKGHICNTDGTSCLIFRPYHLCGVETAYSILSAALRKTSTSGWKMRQRYDLFGRAKQNFVAGTDLHGAYDKNWETFLAPAVQLGDVATDNLIPYHIATGSRLAKDVSAGTILTQNMVAKVSESSLWKLRYLQDNTNKKLF